MIQTYLLKAPPTLFTEIDNAREVLSMTRADFIRLSVRRNLQYFAKVELPLYQELNEKQQNAKSPLSFYEDTYSSRRFNEYL